MKIMRVVVLTAMTIIMSFCIAGGQSFDVDHIDGLWEDSNGMFGTPGTYYIHTGLDVTYYLRLTNPSATTTIKGMTNGFELTGNDVAPVTVDVYGMPGFFDLVNSITLIDGLTADTVCLGYSVMMMPGIPASFNEITHTITTSVQTDNVEMCIDSAYYPPSGLWLWAMSDASSVEPAWGGPYCYVSKTILPLPPEITNCPTAAYTGDHCLVVSYDFDASDPIGDPLSFEITDGIGSIDAVTGLWSYAPTLADVGSPLSVSVVAISSSQGPPCVYDLLFTNLAPEFTSGCRQTIYGGTDMISSASFTFDNIDCDPSSLYIVSISPTPDAGATYGLNGNSLEFTPTINDTGSVFTFIVGITDGVDSTTCEVYFDIKGETNFQIIIEKDHGDDYYPYGVIQGQHTFIDVDMLSGSEIPAGFDFLISYDASALFFQAATPGGAFYAEGCGWEYFTYRTGPFGNCGSACPSGIVRVVGFAETNNGPSHPSCLKPALPATMFTMDFLVTNDRTFECMFIPIRLFWMDCGDNSLAYYPLTAQDSVVQGVEASVWNYYDGYGSETVYYEVTTDPTVFPNSFGIPEACLTQNEDPDKPRPRRIIDFYNGGIDIICAEDIDGRGDINLNGIDNEIADAVLLSNYFIKGLSVFMVNIDGQIAASDVNADGLTLSVADLVYLVRIIAGDAVPYAKLIPMNVNFTDNNGILNVDSEIGGAFLTVAGNITPTLLADNMELKYAYNGANTRILVSSMDGEIFSGDFLQINGTILSIELATADGAAATVAEMPSTYSLDQNYPNPFNPVTSISFAMEKAGDYTLTIYNVTGQKVAEFAGSVQAGEHTVEWNAIGQSSGVYFYRLSTDNFSDTRKMILLK